MPIPTTFQTAGPFNLGGGEIVVLFTGLFWALVAFWLIPRIVRAFGEGIGQGIAKGQQDAARREDSPQPQK